jgi:tol-pal system protein YbgF
VPREGWRATLLIVSAVLAIAGCATRGRVERLQQSLDRLTTEVTPILEGQDQAIRERARLLAEITALEHRVQESTARLRETRDELVRLGVRMEQAEGEIQTTRQAVATLATPPPPPAPPPKAAIDPEEAFATALAMFRSGEHAQAVLDLGEFLARNPEHPLAAEAQFLIGEAYYVERYYEQALVELRKALDRAPRGPRAPDALLRIGLAYAGLRDQRSARQAFQRLVRDYPESDAAARARELLKARGSGTPARR